MLRPESDAWFARAEIATPGGVNSPARSFKKVGGVPVVMARGEGAHLFDVDGHRYIDYVAAFGPLVLGHGHPAVVAAVERQARTLVLPGTPAPEEIRLTETLVDSIPGLEQVRLTTTGTEAVMSAVRLARAVTGRELIVKFAGTYHGHSDAMLAEAGSGAATMSDSVRGGIPAAVAAGVVTVPFNDAAGLASLLDAYGSQVAAILTEPVVGNMGIVAPEPGYLKTMAHLCHAHGALLIFDEVIMAFRLHYGAAGPLLGVVPDLYCLGKTIGGGLPLAGFGGKRELMAWVSPEGPVFQAGTHAGNPLSAAAGLATLEVLRTENPYPRMEAQAARLVEGIHTVAGRCHVPLSVNRMGSGFTVYFGMRERVTNYQEAQRQDGELFARAYQGFLEHGIYLPPSPMEAWFVSAQHTEQDIEDTLSAIDQVLSSL